MEDVLAQMRDNHAAVMIGTKTFTVNAKCCVKTRSKRGAVRTAVTMPARRRVAPIRPEMVSEYPYGPCNIN